MNILISGASGLIGSALTAALQARGDKVTGVSRTPSPNQVRWEEVTPDLMNDFDAVINLAGESIAGRWTKGKKRRILNSRVNSTSVLAAAITGSKDPPRCMVQASAAGFYGDRKDQILDEEARSGDGFLSEVCQQWEAAASPVTDAGTRLVTARFGIVLAAGPGALGRLVLVTRLFLGGPLGTGRQWWSWVSLNDAVRAILFLLDQQISGAVNIATINPQPQKVFASTLGRVLHRPTLTPAPRFAVTAALGEMGASLLLASTRLTPSVLDEKGFEFRDPDLESALRIILAT
ncbi:MAG: TIGR01777 family oxidoreductase [Acidimicrobiales bacterium]|jgi:hypothetical protein|nr:TIGR01777 family oxidoreductase [Acidimicrobiales bacterium]